MENNIFLSLGDYDRDFSYAIMDSEPRIYIIKQWQLAGQYSSEAETGMLKCWNFYINKTWFSTYETDISNIIKNSEEYLASAEEDMTDEQKLFFVSSTFVNNTDYNDGSFIKTALGNRYGKCGGCGMAVTHLSQRLNILGVYGTGYTSGGEYHAFSYLEIPDSVSQIKLYIGTSGVASNHGSIGDVNFYTI